MNVSQIEPYIKYVTDTTGEKTEVIIPINLWEKLLDLLTPTESGLHPDDEYEPNATILADLKQSVKEAAADQTYPVSDLWADVET